MKKNTITLKIRDQNHPVYLPPDLYAIIAKKAGKEKISISHYILNTLQDKIGDEWKRQEI